MATTAKNLKGFYKQTKSNITGGISKTKSPSLKASPKHATTQASGATTPAAALVSQGSSNVDEDYDKKEEMLRQFDMNMAYGPCLGMTRVDRWERALRLGMNPPNEIETLLKADMVQQECLWQGRV